MGIFNTYLHELLAPLYHKGVGNYVDDIYIFNDTEQEHLATLKELFEILVINNLTVNLKKCQIN